MQAAFRRSLDTHERKGNMFSMGGTDHSAYAPPIGSSVLYDRHAMFKGT